MRIVSAHSFSRPSPWCQLLTSLGTFLKPKKPVLVLLLKSEIWASKIERSNWLYWMIHEWAVSQVARREELQKRKGFPGDSNSKNLPASAGDLGSIPGSGRCPGGEPACQCRRPGFHPWVGKMPWRRAWQPTPVFLPGIPWTESLVGYSPWGHKKVGHDFS